MGTWQGPVEQRSIGRPKGIVNKNQRLSIRINAELTNVALDFIKLVIRQAMDGSIEHQKMLWNQYFKKGDPLIQVALLQTMEDDPVNGLHVHFVAAEPQPDAVVSRTFDVLDSQAVPSQLPEGVVPIRRNLLGKMKGGI